MDVLNLAHGALYLVGAYVAVRFAGDGQATLGAFLLAGLAAVAVGAAAGAGLAVLTRPLARRGHLDQALLTLGVALIIVSIFYYSPTVLPQRKPGPIDWLEDKLYTGLLFVAVALLAYDLLGKTLVPG
jgi:branched-subunit amino acid ABC-type transport system permease component